MNTVGQIPTPTLRDLLNAHRDEIMAGFNCHQTGTIVSFDATKQTAKVQLNVQRTIYNRLQTSQEQDNTPTIINYPVLVDVPVFFLTGGNARITMPVTAGDTCLVLFNDRDLDPWFTTGAQAVPNTSRMHSLADGLALVGFRSQANKVSDYSSTDVEVVFGDARIQVKPNGTVKVTAVSIELNGTGDTANTLKLNENGTVQLTAITDSGFATVSLTNKVSLGNNSYTLKQVVDLMITAMTALNAKTGPSAAVQIAAAQSAADTLMP